MNNHYSNTFWKLISQSQIVIPKLQRDYAQGRPDLEIKQIRESLFSEMHEALTQNGKSLVLNFIYGERKDMVFVPIDGQQRLTSLFLLHWYIFAKTQFIEGLEKIRGFSYCTRDTSERFCKCLIDTGNYLDFTSNQLSEQIKDSYWFSGNFESDPTVKSMLCVIDCIHSYFKSENCQEICKRLINDSCPISFLWLPMDNFQNTDDLYIKMNARGKLLSDFEIFKAKLQSSNVLNLVFGGHANEKDRILFISKFNNEYSELFFRHLGDKYDLSMIGFFKTIIRDDYFAYACEKGVQQKYYRNDYKRIDYYNGSMLFRFVEQGGLGNSEYHLCDKANLIIANTVKKIEKIFNILYKNETSIDVPGCLSKYHWSESDLFFVDYSQATARESLVRYCLFEYLNKFGYPKTPDQQKAFSIWKRYIYNLVTNTDVSAHIEYLCQTMVCIQKMVGNINIESEDSLYQLMEELNIESLSSWTTGIEAQLKEEKIKAILMRRNPVWKQAILDSEEYFEDGQIGFLLEYAKVNKGYNLQKFSEGFTAAKLLFERKKKLAPGCKSQLLEKALLCMEDNTNEKSGHLLKQSNSTTTWGFCGEDYSKLLSNNIQSQKREIVLELMTRLTNEININEQLIKIANSFDCNSLGIKEKWKEAFIKNNLFSVPLAGYRFNNCIHLSKNNTEVLLLIGTTVRSYSMELYTYLLYLQLIKNGINENLMKLAIQTTGDILKDGFPIRFIEYKGHKIAYLNEIPGVFVVKDSNEVVVKKTSDEIVQYILTI